MSLKVIDFHTGQDYRSQFMNLTFKNIFQMTNTLTMRIGNKYLEMTAIDKIPLQ